MEVTRIEVWIDGRGYHRRMVMEVVIGDVMDVETTVRAYDLNREIRVDSPKVVPNPPKDTDGRREESGRGVRELQGK